MVQPHPPGSGGAQPPRGRSTLGGSPSAVNVGLVVLAALLLLGVVTGGGRETMTQLFSFLVFYCGVFTLVSLTLTVIVGLVATDRIMLVARHRVWVQSVHRTLGIVAISMLGLHIATELMAARVSVFGALVPFTTAPFTIGAGSIAAYLMIMVMWTGMVRARFAQTGKPWMWRPLHATAYLCWPVALWHGLNAGRPPAVWVTASYLLLAFLTFVALGLRLSVERNRRRQQLTADRTTTEIAPIGRIAPAGYERRTAPRSSRRFQWDAPPADQLWSTSDSKADLRADYRREAVAEAEPVTAIPSYEDSFVEPVFEPPYEPVYEPVAEPARGVATPVYDDYDPYASYEEQRREEPRYEEPRYEEPRYEEQRYEEPRYEEPRYEEPVRVDEAAPMTLRDRFAARRAAAAAEAEARHADDDTPTLVNLDLRRELRRQEREEAQQKRGRRHAAAEEDDDIDFWNRMRGEAR
ncbi:hypothetical protein ACQP00_51275 [Dactylosporangium sp. CS-047395]|uniref:hypothetical protein n=1 Tax=Dactylosporangium sp. CS-047395 TaxID=3239936 RepID=UPI003D9287E2